jgi:hypothetical protein
VKGYVVGDWGRHAEICLRHLKRFRGGSYVLAPLVLIAHGSGRHQFQMLVDSVFRQAGPSDQMSIFDRLQHCRFCRAE